MKTLFFCGFVSLISWETCHAQDKSKDVSNEGKFDEDKVYVILEHYAEFPGGNAKLDKYFQSQIKRTQKKMKGKGPRIVVNYEIDKTGKTRNARVTNNVSGPWADEAIRIIRDMPTWKPGEHKGRPVIETTARALRFDK